MNLLLRRLWTTDESTIGCLYVNNVFECFSLEDSPGSTLIADGKYPIIIDWSHRFEQLMPHILDVPGHVGIRIHSGNTSADTTGCILVGDKRGSNMIWESRKAYARLFGKMLEARRAKEAMTIMVQQG